MYDEAQTLYPDHSLLPQPHIITLVIINSLLILSNIAASLLLSYAILKLGLLKSISHRLIFALTISDCSIGIILQPSLVAILMVKHADLQKTAAMIGQFSAFLFAHFSSVMIMIIALDRYLHMRYLQQYSVYMTKKRCHVMILCNFMANFILAVIAVFSSFEGFFIYLNIAFTAVDALLLLAVVCLYSCTYLSIRKRVSVMDLNKGFSARRKRYDFELAKGMMFVLLSIFICYAPFNVFEAIIYFKSHMNAKLTNGNKSLLIGYYWSLLIIFCSPTCNAVLFIAFNRRIRSFAKSFIWQMHDVQEEQVSNENKDATTPAS